MRLSILYFLTLILAFSGQALAQAPVARIRLQRPQDTAGCAPLVVTLLDSSTGTVVSRQWTTSVGGNSTNTPYTTVFAQPGSYKILLRVTNASGSSRDSITINVYGSPIPTFSSTDTAGCVPYTANFSAVGTTAGSNGGSIVRYEWIWGDGKRDTVTNGVVTRSHQYITGGNYTPVLRVTNTRGCSQLFPQTSQNAVTIRVGNGVITSFRDSNVLVCIAPLPVFFSNTSIGDVANSNFIWDFGDGSPPQQINNTSPNGVSHNYQASGIYTVKLLSVSANGCRDSSSNSVAVSGFVTKIIGDSVTCVRRSVAYTFTSNTTPDNFSWSISPAVAGWSPVPGRNQNITFVTPGFYTISLYLNYGSCDTTITKIIDVNPSPVVSFSANDSVSCTRPFTVNFTTPVNGISYLWRFGNGANPRTSTLQNPGSVTYPNLGLNTVTLIISNGDGCTDSLVKTNYIRVDSARANIAAVPRLCSGPNGYTPVYSGSGSPDGIAEYRFTFQQLTPTPGPLISVVVLPNQPPPRFPTPVAGTYRVGLIVLSRKGCLSGEFSRILTVGEQVTATISKNKSLICVDEEVNFSVNQPAAPTTTFNWNFGPSSTPSASLVRVPPPVRYLTSGIKPISLTIITNNCETILTDTVIVKPPTANFVDSLADCGGNRTIFNFRNTSTGEVDINSNVYQWVYGYNINTPVGLGTSSGINGTFDFTGQPAGTYTVWLKATDVSNPPNGCEDTVIRTIFLVPQGSLSMNTSAREVCKGETLTFSTNQPFAGAIASYSWLVQNNNTTVFTANNSTFSSRTIRFPNTGTWRVRLITRDRNGCTNTFLDSGIVKGMKAGFSITPNSGCTNQALNFTDTSVTTQPGTTIISRNWIFGNGDTNIGNNINVSYAYPAEGRYTVKLLLVDSEGCKDSVTKVNAIKIGDARAGFISIDTMSCPGQQVRFSDTSYGDITDWKWYFSLGNNNSLTDIASNPVFRYTDDDTTIKHTIALVITASSGCRDSIVKQQYITIKKPKAAFSPADTSSKCPPLVLDYRDSSYYAQSWNWDFDDLGAVSSDTSASHTFLIPRSYNVRLVVTSPGGCRDTAQGRVQVDGPFGQLTYGPPLIACDSLKLTNLKVTARLAVAYVWLYGDGQSDFSTSDTVRSHTYYWDSASNGKFVPTVILYDTTYYTDFNNRCGVPLIGSYTGLDTFNINKFDDTLTVERTLPISLADKFLLCDSGTVQFRDSTISNASGLSHFWIFGDGQTSTDISPRHFYAGPGVYNVRHLITSLSSVACEDSAQIITVRVVSSPQPVILLPSGDSLCRPAPFRFAGSRSPGDTSNIALWIWDWRFGNGAFSNVQNPPVQIFPNSGVFADTLIVRNASGCPDTAYRNVFVPSDDDLKVGFTRSLFNLCDTGVVQFTDTSIINVGGTVTYNWNFGDAGPGSTVQNPAHFYNSPGLYPVKLIVSTTKNCIDSFTAPVRVIRKADSLQLAFSAIPRVICDSGITRFTDNSLIRIPGGYTYGWTFGDATPGSTQQNPDHKYTALGNYNVTLRILAAQPSCSDSLTIPNFIKVVGKPVPVINIQPNDSLCFPALFVFSGSNTDTSTVINWQWTLGNGTTFNGINPPPQAFNTVGTFTNTLNVTNSSGCVQSVSRSSTVMPLPNLRISDDTVICRGTPATLIASGADRYQWSPVNNLSAPESEVTLASPSIDQTYLLTAFTNFGCQADTFVRVQVFQPYVLGIVQAADTICGTESTQIFAFGAPNYLWTPAQGLSNVNVPNPVARPDTTTLYTVTGFDSLGCFTQTKTVEVRKFALPLVSLPASVVLNAGTTYTLSPTVSSDVIRYQWAPAAGLSSSTIANPSLIATANRRYTLTVTNNGECSSSDTIQILVTCDDGNVYIPNTFSPNNDGINDRFTPRGIGLSTIRSMRIFNRWGKMVWEKRNLGANNLNDGWDGKIDGKMPQSDAYVYMVEIICSTGQILKYTGTITLVN